MCLRGAIIEPPLGQSREISGTSRASSTKSRPTLDEVTSIGSPSWNKYATAVSKGYEGTFDEWKLRFDGSRKILGGTLSFISSSFNGFLELYDY